MSSPPYSEPDWAALRAAVAGQVVLPGSPYYEWLRRPAIALFHGTRPRAVVTCCTPADVAEILALARRHGLPVAPRSGGHCSPGASLESAHNLSRSEYFNGPLPGDAVAALVRNLDADRRSGQARELDFTP